ncbi:universal stress protein [Paraburkholderia ferrariae]|uniref:universal stress protein n=1 Tax=Paraburkholderia ferrariae TaxID=386056 RepID=UPI0004863566|nr:universal stress protein [Paraburkholderia ferrariae]
MCYKTLLVHLDDSERCAVRRAFALDLAERFDAHLIGFYLPHTAWPARAPAADSRTPEERCELARTQFLEAAARAGRSVEWRAPWPCDAVVATLHARHADLLVLGQNENGDRGLQASERFVTHLVMTAARPAIVVPQAGDFPAPGQNVLIAWDGSREAARAASDALPLLRRANAVSIEMIVPHRESARMRAEEELLDAAAWLDLHGIYASFHESAARGFETGAAILSRASDVHADLIVAGAYAHARIEERVLGGVTRTLLESMTVPVLLSH